MRLRGGWQFFGPLLIFVHFVFPFALLLSRSLKRQGRRLILIALLILFMRLVDLFWQTAPNFYKGTESGFATFGLVDAVCQNRSTRRMNSIRDRKSTRLNSSHT